MLRNREPVYSYTEGPELGHGRIDPRTYRIYNGSNIVVDTDKWGADLAIIQYESDTVRKSIGPRTSETRLYVICLPQPSRDLETSCENTG